MRPIDSCLYLLFTPGLCRTDPWQTLRRALKGGVDLVQWRVKTPDPDGARRCLDTCRDLGVPLIVNDDVELAIALGADGAHVGQDDLDARTARARLGPDAWLGVSTHDLGEITAAAAAGADYLGFGPVFPTATRGYRQAQPRGALRAALLATGLPVFAIGGIDPGNLSEVLATGCRRVAVSSCILGARAPRAVAATLREQLAAHPG